MEIHAEADRSFSRNERLLGPLGAFGPANPVLVGLRRVEQEIEQRGVEPAQTALLGRLAPRRADAIVLARTQPEVSVQPAASRVAPAVVTAQPEGWPRVLAKKDNSIVLASYEEPERQVGTGAERSTLAFTSAPMVPGLVSTPASVTPRPAITPLYAVDALLAVNLRRSPKGGAINLPLAQRRHRISVRERFALSRRGDPASERTAVATAYTGSDPLSDMRAGFDAVQRRAPAFIMPFANGRVTSLFNQGRRHPAIDLAGRHGSPVLATSGGQQVTFAGWRNGYGMAVITRDREGREHLYGHLSAINTRVGVVLAQGQRLGALGSTGYSTGPHVHYEVKDRRGAHINPVTLLFPGRRVAIGYAWADPGLGTAHRPAATAEVRRSSRMR